jgi:uncharacterized protein YihD (DUF1040 family)
MRPAERIPDVLRRLEIAWKKFPDMRLGQLLLAAWGPEGLFNVEDQELVEAIEGAVGLWQLRS